MQELDVVACKKVVLSCQSVEVEEEDPLKTNNWRITAKKGEIKKRKFLIVLLDGKLKNRKV
jgi:hypothetical protein